MWQEKNNSLYQKFSFKDFDEAFNFIEKLAALAKGANHHPEFKSNYNEVEVWLTTHSEGKVSSKDKEFAQKIDAVLAKKPTKNQQILNHAKLFTDGGSRGNPGPSATGVVLLDMEDNVVKKSSKYIGETTNNQAEYQALKEGLELAKSLGASELEVYMDSELIVKQINGLYKIKKPELIPLYHEVKVLEKKFQKISFTHVPRAMNKLADALVNETLDNR